MLAIAVAVCASCGSEEETASFTVLEPDKCTSQELIIIEDVDRPSAKTLTNIVQEQTRQAVETCPLLSSIRIQHFLEGQLWYVDSNSESDWMIGNWQQIPLGERERIVLDELNLFRQHLADERPESGATNEQD